MKKIMFNDKYGLTKAVLEGRKTMTRRIVPERFHQLLDVASKPVLIIPLESIPDGLTVEDFAEQFAKQAPTVVTIRNSPDIQVEDGMGEFIRKVSRFNPGEVVAVAQSYKDAGVDPSVEQSGVFQPTVGDSAGWNNKMFVQAWLMPHRIRITNIRVERLQDITDEDSLLEGIDRVYYGSEVWFRAYNKKDACMCARTPKKAFAALIDKVSGKGTWESNPWVFVYEFELVK